MTPETGLVIIFVVITALYGADFIHEWFSKHIGAKGDSK